MEKEQWCEGPRKASLCLGLLDSRLNNVQTGLPPPNTCLILLGITSTTKMPEAIKHGFQIKRYI